MTVRLSGNTYMVRDRLRQHGWAWEQASKCWRKEIAATNSDDAISAGHTAVHVAVGNRLGDYDAPQYTLEVVA